MRKQIKSRIVWGFNPVTRVKKSKRLYSRGISKKYLQDSIKDI